MVMLSCCLLLEREVFKMPQKGGGWCMYHLLNFLSCCGALKVGVKWGREFMALWAHSKKEKKHMVASLEQLDSSVQTLGRDEEITEGE